MKGVILFSLGLMMLLLALSCDAKAPKNKRFRRAKPKPKPKPGLWSKPSVCSQKTTSGKCCSIPFTYKGVTYNSCTKVEDSKPWCSYHRYHITGQWGYCQPKNHRVRKEFTSMTYGERKRYLNVVFKASTEEPYKTNYEILLAKHRTLFFTDIHQKKHFLTWHRWFTLQYENLLRQIDSRVTVPYWDWSSSNPFDTSSKGVWNSYSGFGGDGAKEFPNCVQTGPFRKGKWKLVPSMKGYCTSNNCTCLARQFGSTPTKEDVQKLLALPAHNFTEFEIMLRNVLHFNVHLAVGGTMFTFNSAAAPEFFLVHAFVDKIWYDWQKKSCAHKYAFLNTVDEYMTGTTTMPYEVVDSFSLPGDVKVKYQDSAAKSRRGQSLIERRRIPGEVDPKIIELFKVSPEEVKKVKEMSEELARRGNNDYHY